MFNRYCSYLFRKFDTSWKVVVCLGTDFNYKGLWFFAVISCAYGIRILFAINF